MKTKYRKVRQHLPVDNIKLIMASIISGGERLRKFVKTIHAHWQGIINYTEAKISNGILEGINSKIQLAKRRARGFRHVTNFINMIYFIAGDLQFDYPRIST